MLFDDDLLRLIMASLLPSDLLACTAACCYWRRAALQDSLWRRCAEQLCADKAPRHALTPQRAAATESAATFRSWRDELYRMEREGARDAISAAELTALTFTFRFTREWLRPMPVRPFCMLDLSSCRASPSACSP